MISRQIETLLQRSKTTGHLLQLQSLSIKTALDHQEHFFSRLILASSLISLQISREIFDKSPITPSRFAWNTLIKGYSKSSIPLESVKMFVDLQRFGIKPDKYTYPFVLKACGRFSMVGLGGTLHSMVLKMGFDWDLHICNTLLRMYGGLHLIAYSRQVFDEMSHRDVVSWSSMIASYVNCNCPVNAITVFQDMIIQHEKPNSITLVSLLAACTRLLNVKLGESIHSHILTNGVGLNVELGTALLEMYAKCGHMLEAFLIFDSISHKNLQSWTVMISSLADNGFGEEAMSLFSKMEEAGLQPDSKSFSAVLSACSHMGLVDEGKDYFDKMVKVHNIRPTMEHYGCLVDMFGRAGKIEEAYHVIKSMPMEPNSVVLRSFISSCRYHGRIVCEEKHLQQLLLKIEPDVGANYVLAGSMCSLSGYWSDTNDLRVSMNKKGLKKVPGSSWVQLSSA
ncbi:pentatricopeptide repeat-containing protein At2g02980, chloroplastic-like [Coffea arabica]|uniref:Pentatricopeptide repeat-containing protein At2g02980, chloroplastic-like n=1 Tax=Coffea arabica TaxID=13443 RepID=A0A6P6VGW0_COFAR|nr:pentatricopeptide repeat-containing protein At2g36730-like [Coffea arabica]XP_027076562.1 pentatricopeptide repeat-containing protein At2g36730-like [Coffea arabica]XP_027076570.1 pentatricopeptide repeat-containing protein At2g36730-like [Coffea arabica]